MQLECCDKDINAISECIPRFDHSCLQDVGFLKKGKFGHVRKVSVLGGPLVFASKHINLHSNDPEDAAKQLANEARILSNLNHENIIKLRAVCSGSFSDSFRNNPSGYFLLFDVLDETLQNRLERWRNGKRTPRTVCSSICKMISKRLPLLSSRVELIELCQEIHTRAKDASAIDIARGLEYLHSNQIVWRDLKPANIGYYRKYDNERNKSSWTVKLIDFGMASKVQDCIWGECCGSQAYMAPEIMRGERFTSKADVFSFGVLLSEICSLCVPYLKSRNKKNIRMTNEEYLDFMRKEVEEEGLLPMDDLGKIIHCSGIRYLINQCWNRPEYRPASTDIVTRLERILTTSKWKASSSTNINLDLTQSTVDDDDLE